MNQITEYSQTEAGLAELAHRYKDRVFDVTTKEGMTGAKEARKEIRAVRLTLEDKRKEIKAPALERCNLIDSEAKRIRERLEELENPISEAIKNEESRKAQAEADRVAKIQGNLDRIKHMPGNVVGKTAAQIDEAVQTLRAIEVDESWDEFRDAATLAKQTALVQLQDMHKTVTAQEAAAEQLAKEREELAKLRAEAEARERAESARRTEENAKLAETNRKQAEELAAARIRIEQAEREKIRAEEQAKAEAKAKETAAPQPSTAVQTAAPSQEGVGQGSVAPAAAKPSVKLTPKGPRPTDDDIIGALANHYRVTESKAVQWLCDMDLDAALERLADQEAA